MAPTSAATVLPTSVRTTDDNDDELDAAASVAAAGNAQNKPTISNVPSLVCAFSASATTGGTSYAFGLYSAALKHNLHLTQGQLDSISTAFFVAGLFSWIPGLCSDRFGTRFALSLGGCTGASSLLLYWAVAREFIAIQRGSLVFVLSSLGVVTFLSCALVTGAVFKIVVAATGPGTKGSAVGAAKGYVGLGAGLYASLFQSFRSYGESDLDFLPMAAFFFITCSTIPALMLLPSKQSLETHVYEDECTGRHIRTLYCSLITMAVLIVAKSMIELYEPTHNGTVGSDAERSGPSYGAGLILIAIWLGPIISLQYLPRNRQSPSNGVMVLLPDHDIDDDGEQDNKDVEADPSVRRRKSDGSQNASGLETPKASTKKSPTGEEEKRGLLVGDISTSEGDDDDADEVVQRSTTVEEEDINLNMLQMLQTPTAWLMLWTTIILVGAGTVETNNMGQMVESLGFTASVTPASLALFSVAQAAARVLTGSLSESALNWNTRWFCIDNGVPRPFFLVVASLVGFFAHSFLCFATSPFVFVFGTALTGVAFGMVWPLMVLISAEVFGIAGAGQNYMFYDGVSSAAGTLLLTKLIAQEVYESHTDPDGPDAKTCIGMGCFQSTHMIVAGLSLTCVVSSIAMLYTSRHVYNKTSLHVT